MASANVAEELCCSICLSVYTDPVMLSCGHNYCRLCIGEALDSQGASGPYSCPECRVEFLRRPRLQKNTKLHNIAEHFRPIPTQGDDTGPLCTYCMQSPVRAVRTCVLCEASLCTNHLRVHSMSVEHVLVEPTASTKNRKCPDHKKVLEYYCYQDRSCICVYCTLGDTHRGHQIAPLAEASGVKKENLGRILETLTTKHEKVANKMHLMESAMAELARKKRLVEELCEAADPLTVLEERESESARFCHVPEIDIINVERRREPMDLWGLIFCIIFLIIAIIPEEERKNIFNRILALWTQYTRQ